MFCEVSIELTLVRSLLPGALGQLHNHPPTGRYGKPQVFLMSNYGVREYVRCVE